MHGPNGRRAAAWLVAAAALACVLSPGSSRAGADDVESLRREDAALAQRARSAALELYGLESALVRARDELETARRVRAAAVSRRQAAARRLRIARATLAVAQRRLAERLNALYVTGGVDPVEVLLGSGSLDEAMDSVQALQAVADHDRGIVANARVARERLTALGRRLAAREAELARVERAAEGRAGSLAATAAARRAFVAELAERRRLGAARISALEQAAVERARAAQADAVRRTAAAPSTAGAATTSAPAPPPVATAGPEPVRATGETTLTVEATGYALRGRTASGVPVGWGVVAVDPGVIPLGTRMTVPGYGEAVAADTGGAVQGARIDLWFPTIGQALAWGRRTVTITLH